MTTPGFDPFAALRWLGALVMAGLVALRLVPALRRHSGRISLVLTAGYLLVGAAVFAVA